MAWTRGRADRDGRDDPANLLPWQAILLSHARWDGPKPEQATVRLQPQFFEVLDLDGLGLERQVRAALEGGARHGT
jgi:hypothetical protein